MKDRFPGRRQSISTSHGPSLHQANSSHETRDCMVVNISLLLLLLSVGVFVGRAAGPHDYANEQRQALSLAPSPAKSTSGSHDARRKSVAPASLSGSPVKSNPQQQQARPPVRRSILKDDNSSNKAGGECSMTLAYGALCLHFQLCQ